MQWDQPPVRAAWLALASALVMATVLGPGVEARAQPSTERRKPRGLGGSPLEERAGPGASAERMRHPFGRQVADIRDFGARPDGSDCTVAIQAAHDSLLSPGGQ